jgi:UDP-N-acetylglucosamine 2-epimerase (non-hydrolysing)
MHILHVVGTRPNLLKVAPVLTALKARGVRQTLVHTGQHYDVNMSDVILRELRLPQPDINLGAGQGSSAEQMAQVIVGVERSLSERKPDMMLVYGDNNSTLAAALAGAKVGVPVGHVEAGLRSGYRHAPDEVSRIMTDRVSTCHFIHSADADANLRAENIAADSIMSVGNVLIDTLVQLMPLSNPQQLLEMFGLINGKGPKPFALVTLHRPSNVDNEARLERILEALSDVAVDLPVIFPVHPRTRARMKDHQLRFSGLLLMQPLSYLQFLGLMRHASVVITDSGGIQEETTYLGVPCLTVRENTDRPITVRLGTNQLIGRRMDCLKAHIANVLSGRAKRGTIPPLWDGQAAERIADHVAGKRQD